MTFGKLLQHVNPCNSYLQILLDRDPISDPAQQPESGDTKDWQQYYDVCTALTSSCSPASSGPYTEV